MARICNDAWRTKARFHVIGLAERTTRNYGLNNYGTVIYTSEQLHKSNPDLVQRFLRATLKRLI